MFQILRDKQSNTRRLMVIEYRGSILTFSGIVSAYILHILYSIFFLLQSKMFQQSAITFFELYYLTIIKKKYGFKQQKIVAI